MSKTTIQGFLTIASGVVTFVLYSMKTGNFTDPAAWTALIGAITAGLGLIHASDAPSAPKS